MSQVADVSKKKLEGAVEENVRIAKAAARKIIDTPNDKPHDMVPHAKTISEKVKQASDDSTKAQYAE